MVNLIRHWTVLGNTRSIVALAVPIHELSTLPPIWDAHQLQALGFYLCWQSAAMCTWNCFDSRMQIPSLRLGVTNCWSLLHISLNCAFLGRCNSNKGFRRPPTTICYTTYPLTSSLPGNRWRRLMSNITQLSKLRNEKWKDSKKTGGRKQREAWSCRCPCLGPKPMPCTDSRGPVSFSVAANRQISESSSKQDTAPTQLVEEMWTCTCT
jgi:hypothetical protein